MNDDQLRAVLRRRDPAAGQPATAASGTARALWEQTMAAPIDEQTSTTGTAPPVISRRRLTFALAAATLAVLAGVGAGVAIGLRTPDRPDQMTLRMPDSVNASCAMFDLGLLRQVPVAFQGTAVEVAGSSTVLRVDRWFRGERDGVTTVRITREAPGAADGDVEFTTGRTYLVSAQDGFVRGCGYSGELHPELLAHYDEAF
jgi:hypothetical protein